MNVDSRDLQRIYRMLVIHADNDESGAMAEEVMEEMNLTMQQYQEYISWAREESEALEKLINHEEEQ